MPKVSSKYAILGRPDAHRRQADLDPGGGHALRNGAGGGAQERAPALAQQLQQRLHRVNCHG